MLISNGFKISGITKLTFAFIAAVAMASIASPAFAQSRHHRARRAQLAKSFANTSCPRSVRAAEMGLIWLPIGVSSSIRTARR